MQVVLGGAWQGAELQLPTRPIVDAPEEELSPRSSSGRWRTMRTASLSSSGADEPSESVARRGKTKWIWGEAERSSEYRLNLTRVCSTDVCYLWGLE